MAKKNRRSNDATAMAGEFFVMEKLYRFGHQPALTMGRAKSIDILVKTQKGNLWEISVKSVCGGGKWGGIETEDVSKWKKRVYVFLHYKNFETITEQPEVYVVPAKKVQELKEPWFKSCMVSFENQKKRKKLEAFRNAWSRFII